MSIKLYRKLLQKITKQFVAHHFDSVAYPYKYTFIVTYKCDSKCNTCGIWKIYKDSPEQIKNELNTDEICKAIDSISKEVIWLNFTGGEPTLRKDLSQIVKYAYNVCPDLQMLNIPMNGLNPNRSYAFYRDILEECKDIQIYATVSLDMLGDDYEKTRGVKGFKQVEKSFQKLLELKEEYPHFHPSFQLTVSEINGLKALDTFDYIKGHGIPIVTFAHEASLFHNKDTDLTTPKEGEANIVAQVLCKIQKRYPIKSLASFMPKIYLSLAQNFIDTKKSPIPCSASSATTTIDPYGNVMACPFYYDKTAGNIRDYNYNLLKLLRSENAVKLRKQIKSCRVCWINCEAIPSILGNFPIAVWCYIRNTLQGLKK